jgi:lipopolysaccharide/colanic/teichoic acid biosynthesis glycosyltransferase
MKNNTHVVIYLAVIDTIGIGLAMALSYYLRIAGGFIPYSGPQDLRSYVRIALLILPVWLVLHAISGLYSFDHLFEGLEEYSRVLRASSFGIIALIVGSFWERPIVLSRGWILMTWLLCMSFVIGGRFLFRKWIYRCRTQGLLTTSSVIVGASEHAISLARQLQRSPHAGSKVIGFLDDDLPSGTVVTDSLKILGPPSDLEYLISHFNVNEVIIVPEALAWESLQDIVRHSAAFTSRNVRVRLSPRLYESMTNDVNVYYKASIPMLTIQDFRITGSAAALKEIADYTAAATLFAVSIPFMALAALAMALSGAPQIIERRSMLGLKGVQFTQLKFYTGVGAGNRRTLDRASLRPDAHSFFGLTGRLLYLTGFDKAPQLWNVLRREMSLVGARPVLWAPDRPDSFMRDILTVKPGMTGLWALTYDTGIEYELASTLYYVRNWNILLDIQILIRTLSVAVSGRLRKIHMDHNYQEGTSDNELAARAAAAESGS